MRIHSSTLTEQDFRDGAKRAGVTVIKMDQRGSKSRARAFDVAFSGSGVNGGMYGNLGYKTATWDEWGIALNHLFDVDPDARVARVYEGAAHFHWATGDRFRTLTPAFVQYRHKWSYQGRNATGAYYVAECEHCEAVNRWMAPGHSFDELVSA